MGTLQLCFALFYIFHKKKKKTKQNWYSFSFLNYCQFCVIRKCVASSSLNDNVVMIVVDADISPRFWTDNKQTNKHTQIGKERVIQLGFNRYSGFLLLLSLIYIGPAWRFTILFLFFIIIFHSIVSINGKTEISALTKRYHWMVNKVCCWFWLTSTSVLLGVYFPMCSN